MMRCKKLMVFIISIMSLISISLNTYALPDVSHNHYEEDKLLDRTWYKTNCTNQISTCQKHILRYESVDEFINYLKKKINDANSQIFSILLKRYSGIVIITITGTTAATILLKLVLSCKNTNSLFALVSTGVAIYVAQPIRKFLLHTLLSIPHVVIEYLKKKLLKKEPIIDEKGLLTKSTDFLFGNKDMNILSLNTDKEIYKSILESLKNKIYNKEYLNNDILIVSWDNDPKDASFSIKFDTIDYKLDYNKNKQEYFKN